jgi:hypothetical protein
METYWTKMGGFYSFCVFFHEFFTVMMSFLQISAKTCELLVSVLFLASLLLSTSLLMLLLLLASLLL